LVVARARRPSDLRSGFARSILLGTDDGPIRVCSYEDLVDLKTRAGRQQDLADLHELRLIHEARDAQD